VSAQRFSLISNVCNRLGRTLQHRKHRLGRSNTRALDMRCGPMGRTPSNTNLSASAAPLPPSGISGCEAARVICHQAARDPRRDGRVTSSWRMSIVALPDRNSLPVDTSHQAIDFLFYPTNSRCCGPLARIPKCCKKRDMILSPWPTPK
jgi:hypothetical protein